MTKYDLSIVIPVYNEQGSILELYSKIKEQFLLLNLSGEIIFINDGSHDKSKELILELCAADIDCKLVSFRTNCGKATALSTGFSLANGKYVITMDADLQDDPVEIPRFLEELKTFDVVSGWKKDRKDPAEKRLPSKLYNATVRFVTDSALHDMNCGFKGYRAEALKEVRLYGELHRYIPALLAARGFRVSEIVVTHHKRKSGKSKYGFERYLRGLFDLITVFYLTKYMRRPLHLFGGAALIMFALGFIFWIITDVSNCLGISVLSISSFAVVLPLLGIGLIAEHIVYNTSPKYIPPVEETKNCE